MSAAQVAASSDRGARGVVFGVLVPLAVAALSYGLWRISDALVYVGPLDRAQFGWAVVIPVWLAVPVVAAFGWARLTPAQATRSAIALNAIIGTIAAWLLWRATVENGLGCQFGSTVSPEVRAVQSIVVGTLIGLDPALAGLLGRRHAVRGSVWRTVATAAGIGFALFWVAALTGAAIASVPGCNRPPVV